MAMTPEENDGWLAQVQSVALDMRKMQQRALSLKQLYDKNLIGADAGFVDGEIMSKNTALLFMGCVEQFLGFLGNQEVTQGDYSASVWQATRKVGV